MAFNTTASGLQYEDTVVGEGAEAKAGQSVTVHYTGWLYNDGQLQLDDLHAVHAECEFRM